MPENPFSDYGVLAYGERFVGRQGALATIEDRIIRTEHPGAIALIGQRRIGKSSLAHHSLIYPREALRTRRIVAVWVPFAEICTSPQAFFLGLIRLFSREFAQMGVSDRFLELHADSARRSAGEWLDLSLSLHDYFRRVRELGWAAVPVIDEFDKARVAFQGFPHAFQAMRELASQPDRRVAFVTTSRRELYDIERKADPESSIFSNVFDHEHLHCFDAAELRQLLARLETIGMNVDADMVAFFTENTGGHPFLTSLLGFRVARAHLDGLAPNLGAALRDRLNGFLEHYAELVDLLQEDGLLEPLLRILFGPTSPDSLARAETLRTYGLIRLGADDHYRAFSEHFTDYLRMKERSVDLWPLWSETECTLRGIIDEVLTAEFKTPDWEAPLLKARPTFSVMVGQWTELRDREKRAAGDYASDRLLDFSHPKELFQLIDAYWTRFQPVLGKSQSHWRAAGDILAGVRKPLAHSRPTSIDEGTRQTAEGHCKSIRDSVARWRRSRPATPTPPLKA